MRFHLAIATPLCVLLCSIAGSAQNADRPSFAQPAQKPATIKVESKLVNVPVVVRDKKGALVGNLTQADFDLKVDTKPQTIRYFDRDTDQPLTLGLLVDTSRSQARALDEERTASSAFLDTMLRPQKDKAFVIQFAHQVELLQDLTDARPKLQAALKQVDTDSSASSNTQENDSGGRSRPHFGGSDGTTLYDAVFLAADELLAKPTGRKAMIVLSDGVDRGSKENLTAAIEAAQRADVMIYAIYFKGDTPFDHEDSNRGMGGGRRGGMGWPGGGGYPGGRRGGGGYPGGNRGGGEPRVDGKKTLDRMATETGGRLFEMTKKQSADDIYKQIAEELRNHYRLAFTPDADAASDGYHQIDLVLKRPDGKSMSLQLRDGYYVGK